MGLLEFVAESTDPVTSLGDRWCSPCSRLIGLAIDILEFRKGNLARHIDVLEIAESMKADKPPAPPDDRPARWSGVTK